MLGWSPSSRGATDATAGHEMLRAMSEDPGLEEEEEEEEDELPSEPPSLSVQFDHEGPLGLSWLHYKDSARRSTCCIKAIKEGG